MVSSQDSIGRAKDLRSYTHMQLCCSKTQSNICVKLYLRQLILLEQNWPHLRHNQHIARLNK